MVVDYLYQFANSPLCGYMLWGILIFYTALPLCIKIIKKVKIDYFNTGLVFRAVYFLYLGIPSFYYFFNKPPLSNYSVIFLNLVLYLSLVGLFAFDRGYAVDIKALLARHLILPTFYQSHKKAILTVLFVALSIICFIWFITSVGGVGSYVENWGKTGSLTKGKMYLLWGIMLAKSAFLVNFALSLNSNKRRSVLWLLPLGILSYSIIFLFGARILVAIYLVECLVIFHYLKKPFSLKVISLFAVIGFLAVVVLMGEARNHTWYQNMSFYDQIKMTLGSGKVYLNVLINSYFDSVRNFIIILDKTPSLFDFQWGRSYVDFLLRPIPYMYRPHILLHEEVLNQVFGGRILPLLGELFLNFNVFGIGIGVFSIGVIAKVNDTFIAVNKHSVFSVVLYASLLTAVMMWIRGSFAGHTPLFLMDFLSLLFFIYVIRRKSSKL